MKLNRLLPIVTFGTLVSITIAQTDILTPALTSELTTECTTDATFRFCAGALKFHGQGRDDQGIDVLAGHAPASAAAHYRIAQSRPKDAFWNLVVKSLGQGARDVACDVDLSVALNRHFLYNPGGLSIADDDAAKNSFLALADLLLDLPSAGFAVNAAYPAVMSRVQAAHIYCACFSDSGPLLYTLKKKLGR